RHAGIRLPQKTNDLLFRKSLLHVQSPSVRELDSKATRYSIQGERRKYRSRQPDVGKPFQENDPHFHALPP
ncbi:MAG: hypothetical protein ACOY5C_12310, partial [Pseudomonadota bacterium]